MVSPASLVERAAVIVHARAEKQVVPPGSRTVELGGRILDVPVEGQIDI